MINPQYLSQQKISGITQKNNPDSIGHNPSKIQKAASGIFNYSDIIKKADINEQSYGYEEFSDGSSSSSSEMTQKMDLVN